MANDLGDESSTGQPFLVRFFDPTIAAEDFRGRTLKDILAFSDRTLESSHDYVQILFPLPEDSMFNWQSPIIDKDTFDAFQSRDDLRQSFERAFARMMAFYGFDVNVTDSTHVELTRSENHLSAFKNWVVRMDHNHLRISRVLRSLRVLGLDAHAAAYHDALLKVNQDFPNRLGARSMMYWKRAATRPLHLAPDEDDDDSMDGPQFLIDYEKAKAESRNG